MILGAVILGSYLLGSMPFGLIVAWRLGGIDVREHGSRNTGATNVYRVVGRTAGVMVFLLDVLKGLAPTLIAGRFGPVSWQVGAGLAAVVGHSASPFLRFHGGKGIATSLGVLFALVPMVALLAWALWGVVLFATGYVSAGSIAAALSLTPLTLWLHPGDMPRLIFVIAGGLLAIVKHRANIIRLANGTENSFRKARSREDNHKK